MLALVALDIDTGPIDALVHQLNTDPATLHQQPDWSALSARPAVRLTSADADALNQLLRALHARRSGAHAARMGTIPATVVSTPPRLADSAHALAMSTLLNPPPATWPGSLVLQFQARQVAAIVLAACGADSSTVPHARLQWLDHSPDITTVATQVVVTARSVVADLREHSAATTA